MNSLIVAVLAVLLPSVIGLLPLDSAVNLLFMLFISIRFIRVKASEKIWLSFVHIALLFLIFYGIISMLWVSDKNSNFLFILALASILGIYSVMCDYFSESVGENYRRIIYLVSFGGALCALVNIAYWLLYIVPFAKNESLSCGFGSSSILAAFMAICCIASLALAKGNNVVRKNALYFFASLMGIVFFLINSLEAWLLLIALIAGLVIVKKKRESIFSNGICIVVIFLTAIILISFSGERGIALSDTLGYGIKSLFGKGGGAFGGKALFLYDIRSACQVGLFGFLTVSSGVIGILISVSLLLFNALCFYKSRNISTYVCLLLTIYLLFMPFNNNITGVCLLTGFMAYCHNCSDMVMKRCLKAAERGRVIRINHVAVFSIIVSAILLILSFVNLNASIKFRNEEFEEAYGLYRTVAKINFTDSDSCRKAAESLRKGKMLKENYAEALELAQKAIERDPDNVDNIKEKARIFYDCTEYDKAAQQYRIVVQMSVNDDECNVLLVNALYKNISGLPKGSSETKRIYDEILEISQKTKDLDYKKKINDIADKALVFTKGELKGEE